MKLRITKWRIAAAVVLLPVLYVLNFGPLLFFCELFGLRKQWVYSLYEPLRKATDQTPLAPIIIWYIHLWVRSDTGVDFAYGWRWRNSPSKSSSVEHFKVAHYSRDCSRRRNARFERSERKRNRPRANTRPEPHRAGSLSPTAPFDVKISGNAIFARFRLHEPRHKNRRDRFENRIHPRNDQQQQRLPPLAMNPLEEIHAAGYSAAELTATANMKPYHLFASLAVRSRGTAFPRACPFPSPGVWTGRGASFQAAGSITYYHLFNYDQRQAALAT